MNTVKRSVNDIFDIPILKTTDRKGADRDQAGRRSGKRHHRRPVRNQDTLFQKKLINGVVVFVYQEDVVDIHANILVCYKYGTSHNEGRIGKRLREKGGEKYAESLDKLLRRRGGLKEWRMYPVKPGYLQFNEVYQAIIPSNPSTDVMDDWLLKLQHLYQFILSTADEKGYKSITFPVANTGPINKCIEVLVSSIKNNKSSNLRQANIVTTEDNSFGKLCRCLSAACSSTSTASKSYESEESSTDGEVDETKDAVYKTKDGEESNTAAIAYPPHKLSNGLIVHLRQEDIVDVPSDVIITSNYGKAETEGIIAKRLREKGGVEYVKSLKLVVRDTDGFKDWQVYSCKPGDLQFSEVYQAIIPPNPSADVIDDWLSNLRGLYSLILATADAQGYTSITLPVLGSGETGATPAKCTEVLKGVLEEYVAENLLDVYIVTKDEFIFTLLMTTW
ncbi:uncharacterized protein LOC126824219 [Patella vulgata]|uniref:uncharacterized protein LOC126824219 n=1 Tax=Patella vulgata TaxID=6465 RepID=UPI0024A92B1B|nr:uncharacterized protein LOC126824219 [Patella vulgata]